MQIRLTSERDNGIKTVRDFQVENRFTITWEGSFFCIDQLENPGQFRPLHLFFAHGWTGVFATSAP